MVKEHDRKTPDFSHLLLSLTRQCLKQALKPVFLKPANTGTLAPNVSHYLAESNSSSSTGMPKAAAIPPP